MLCCVILECTSFSFLVSASFPICVSAPLGLRANGNQRGASLKVSRPLHLHFWITMNESVCSGWRNHLKGSLKRVFGIQKCCVGSLEAGL